MLSNLGLIKAELAPSSKTSLPLAPATFEINDLVITPAQAGNGETLNISVFVRNTGELLGSITINLRINDTIEQSKGITLAGGDGSRLAFTLKRDEPGNYTVDVSGLTGSFTVTKAPSASPSKSPSPLTCLNTNWHILGPIIGVAIFLTIFVLYRMRRRNGNGINKSLSPHPAHR